MNKRFSTQVLTTLAVVILAAFVFTSMALAAEFSATIKQKITGPGGAMDMNGTIYVKGMMQRQDITGPMGKQTVIMRPDKGVMWMIMPAQKSYMERPIQKLDVKTPPSIDTMLKRMPNHKKIGSEKIGGYVCDKYKFNDTTRKISGVVFISQKLKQEMKSDVQTPQGKVSLTMTNVKEGTQKASLFNIPAGYKKTTMPQMGPGMGGPGGPPPGPRKNPGGGMPPGFPK